ncbi:EAL domain-containing protein [Thalassotalea piscium]
MYKTLNRCWFPQNKSIFLLANILPIVLLFFGFFAKAKEVTIPYLNTEIRFQSLNTYDGLSQSYVYDIIQDTNGFIWIATDDGLNRYDGKEFIHYRSDTFDPHSIAHNFIRNLYIDNTNTLWVGTYDGLSRYNPQLDNFDNFVHDDNNSESLTDNIIWDVYQDNAGTIWVATESGLHKYNSAAETFSPIKVRGLRDKLNEIKTIFQDKKGNYWLGTYENGIYIVSEDFSSAVSLQAKNKWNLQLPTNSINQIEIIDNNYWLATNNGVFVVDETYKVVEKYSFKNQTSPDLTTAIKSIENINNTHVWLATTDGIKIINLLSGNINEYHANKNISTSISHDEIYSLEKDIYNKVWIGSKNGVNIYDPNANLFKSSSQINATLNGPVESFIQFDDSVWLSSNGQLYKLDEKNKTIHNIQTSLSTPIYQILTNNKKILLLTETDELFTLEPDGKITQHIEWKNILRLEAWRKVIFINSNVWFINTDGILTSYNIDTKEIENKANIQAQHIRAFDTSSQENLFWVVTIDGSIYQYNALTDELVSIPFTPQSNFATSKATSIKCNGNWLLLGSESQGILLINVSTQESFVFNENNGLNNNFIADIQTDDDNNYWFSTNKGISSLSTQTKTIRTFESPFDLKNNEYLNGSSLITTSGIAYFGGLQGFRYFNTADFHSNEHQFNKPILTQLLIANKVIKVDPKPEKTKRLNKQQTLSIPQSLNNLELLNLKYIHSPITIEFSSPNPEMTQDLRYRYRLQDIEENWIETTPRKAYATYTNLSAGDYTFQLQVYDVLNPTVFKSKTLPIRIQPPWWLSRSAMLFYSLLTLLVIVYVFQQMRHKRLYHLQIKQSEERLKLSLWGSGDEMWDWNIKSGKIYRSNIWGILEFPQDGKRNVGGDKTNVHEHDMPRIREALDAHFNGVTDHFESTYRVRNKDNHWVWVLDRGKVVERDEKNLPTRMTGTLKDISQIKKADERLKLFAKCIENISDAVIIYDRLFNIVDVNKSYQRITNKTKRQMIGKSMTFTQYPDHFTQNVKRHLLQKGGWHGEIESKRENGESYLTDLNIDIIRDESGNISHFVGVFSDITKRKETEAELRKLANTDTLTGLPNRSYFQANQIRLVKTAIPHALLVFDLDNFKKVNDSMGHEVGDILLCKVAERMRSIGRKHDTVYRLGGDEFSIIVENTNDIHTITSIAKQILKTIAEPLKLRNQEVVLFSSIGIVLYPEDGANPHELLKNADTAMYHAKNAGGNRYQFFSDSMNKKAVKRLQIENLIRHGLKEDYFSVFYQPKIEISTGKIAGMEALVRFETPSKGIISPVLFIPVSEETGQIIDIGEIVLRKACFATKKWVDSGLFDGRIAVNLSAVQFTQPNLVGMISDILQESQLPAKYLELEITEGTVMNSPQAAIETMLQIRAMGIHLSLDDFGTGYSSLAYLKKFPLNTLKIDKAFVDDIETSEQGRNMVATIVTIAHNLGLQVVAEGVETNQQLSFLAGLRCEQLQGYLYSKPLPEMDFRSYLLSHQITDKSTSFHRL